jgi:hypothetical protein
MDVYHNEFFNTTSDAGYVDGVPVKGLTSYTKANGIGSFIICLKDEYGVFHQKCLEDVLYVPTLLHHHFSRIFSVISTCSQDDFQRHFQSISYVLNLRSTKIDLQLSKI